MRALAARLGSTRARAPLLGTVVLGVPCVGVLHPDTIRGALDAGARGVYIAACMPEDCHFREGATWLAQRLTGERLPKLTGVPAAPGAARLRVAVRHVAGVTASSRGPSAEDLERLPRHMRPPGGAAGLARGPRADTRLTVVVDGRPVLARTYRPTGFGHDGPTYVYKELPLAPGPHRIEVRLGEADGPGRGG